MLHKIITSGLTLILFLGLLSPSAFAQTKGDWNGVVSRVNGEVSVRTANGQTVYGKLTAANDGELTIQIADKSGLTAQNLTLRRGDIRKVWNARLKSGKGLGKPASAAIGAAAGAGAGLGIGLGALGATGGSDSGGAIVAVLVAAGAGLGAAAGYFMGKQGHKKLDLLYEN